MSDRSEHVEMREPIPSDHPLRKNKQESNEEIHRISNALASESVKSCLGKISCDDEETIELSLLTLAALCTDKSQEKCMQNRAHVRLLEGHKLIVNAMLRWKSSPSVLYASCRALTCSICNTSIEEKREVVVNFGAFIPVSEALHSFPDDERIQTSGCQFLANITPVTSFLAIEAVLRATNKFPEHLEMQRIGCLYFCNIGTYGNQISPDKLVDLVRAIVVAMQTFPLSRSLQYCGCSALLKLRLSAVSDRIILTDDALVVVEDALSEFRDDDRILNTARLFLAKNSIVTDVDK